MNQEIFELVRKKGILLEKEIFELLDSIKDPDTARAFLENLEKLSGQKLITKSTLTKNFEYVQHMVNTFSGETKSLAEKTFIKMGIEIEIKKETAIEKAEGERKKEDYQVFYHTIDNNRKIDVGDFVEHFRSRYGQIQKILMQRTGMENLVSIGKIGANRQKLSFIGIVSDKRITGNNNIVITFEDLTGSISALVRADSECFVNARNLQLDDVVAVRASGNRDIVYVHDLIYPDAFKEKVRFEREINVAFVSDVHVGSKKHLGKEFLSFIEWLNSDNETAKKIKYIFFVGDNVDGVGVFPDQENMLELKSLNQQYEVLSGYLEKIPKHITMFMCPGQHDSVRVAEPQPVIDNFYGSSLYDISNLVLVQNPSLVKLTEGDKEFKILMYHGASIHAYINDIDELRMIKAHKSPAKAVKFMLKKRHLANSHGISPSIVYVPNPSQDPLVIEEVPDVLCTGEVHRLDIENYNGVLIITGSCWQSQTDFEEKVGNIPDPCKVPVLNLKTKELKVFDFT